MPTYDYECQKCSHVFEAFQNMSDDPLDTCPVCGGGVKRLIGGGLGVIFKGSGFYVTDNKSSGKAASPGASKKSETAVKENSSGDTAAPAASEGKGKSSEKVSATS